jgi:hypothetical protein
MAITATLRTIGLAMAVIHFRCISAYHRDRIG